MMFERERHSPGATRRAHALRDRMTWSERAPWKELRKLKANVRRQAPIGRYIVDFACHGRGLVIEVDLGIHERLDEVALRDGERQIWLQEQGYKALRFTDRQVENDLEDCIRPVRSFLGLPALSDDLQPIEALLLDGGGLGGGEGRAHGPRTLEASAPTRVKASQVLRTPPSATLPPSRRKGE